jgi:hypothetical protein
MTELFVFLGGSSRRFGNVSTRRFDFEFEFFSAVAASSA